MNGAFERAKAILSENRDKLDGLSDLVMERETIDRREFEAFMKRRGRFPSAMRIRSLRSFGSPNR